MILRFQERKGSNDKFKTPKKVIKFLNTSEKHECYWYREQETHSLSKDKKKRIGDFQCQTVFPQGKCNYCEVDIGFYRTQKISVIDKKNDANGRVLLFKVKINSNAYVLACVYDNTEPYQLNYVAELHSLSNLL